MNLRCSDLVFFKSHTFTKCSFLSAIKVCVSAFVYGWAGVLPRLADDETRRVSLGDGGGPSSPTSVTYLTGKRRYCAKMC